MDTGTLVDVDLVAAVADDVRIEVLGLAAVLEAVVGHLEPTLRERHPALLPGVIVHGRGLPDVPAQHQDLEQATLRERARLIKIPRDVDQQEMPGKRTSQPGSFCPGATKEKNRRGV